MRTFLERFLYIVITIAFTVAVLFTLIFALDKNAFYQLSDKIPVLNKLVPDPAETISTSDEQLIIKNQEEKISQLTTEVNTQKQKIAELESTKDQQYTEEAEQPAPSIAPVTEPTASEEDKKLKIQQTASMFGKMSPKKAAPIFESMDMDERVLLLSHMGTESQVKLMEQLDVTIAANTSSVLQKAVTFKDQSISDFEKQITELSAPYMNSTTPSTKALTKEDVSKTFEGMDTKDAATILVQLGNVNPSKVLDILTNMGDQPRASVLSAINELDKSLATSLTLKLGQ